MLIDAIEKRIASSGCVDGFWGRLDAGEDATLGVAASARPLLVAARFARALQPTLVVISGEEAADAFARNLVAYLGRRTVLRFPERADVPGAGKPVPAETVSDRLRALHALSSGEHVVVVASAASLLRTLPPPSAHVAEPLILRQGDDLSRQLIPGVEDLDSLKAALAARGYANTGELDGPGTFAIHGGVLDVFPGNMAHPVRIDLFGDEVEELRRIIASTGQAISSILEVAIYPVTEAPFGRNERRAARDALEKAALTDKRARALLAKMDEGGAFEGDEALIPFSCKKTATIGDYVGADALCALIEPRSLIDNMVNESVTLAAAFADSPYPTTGMLAEPTNISFGDCLHATYGSIMQLASRSDDDLPVKRTDVAGAPERLYAKLRTWIEARYLCAFSIPDARARRAIALELVDQSLPITDAADRPEDGAGERGSLERGVVNLISEDIPLGLVIPSAKIALVSLGDTKRMNAEAGSKRRLDITDITFAYKPGDYVVHSTYGIALFKDIVRRDMDGVERDYIELDYAEGDKLFLPIDQFDKVTRYVGPEGVKPKITRLDSSDWSRAITRARRSARKLAFDLVDVYARRAAAQGHRFSVDTPWMRQMEDSFPYQETPDQLKAIEDVFADMRSDKPMDRLICGDVGFGKTEVAIRAAFAAAQERKQVMVLCPTTILAQQHFTSFKERMAPFGMRVEVLSRFRTPAQQKATLEAFAKGEVDVLVGTHRLLSRDVNPHALGLVIIDEEQRFGVAHKEQFKNLRESVDVLTLSATPIPRTMQMATSGVRDMSLIMTPPDERLPVKVHVGEWDPDVVSEAIRFELARGGQVYYVSNRVRTIDDALERVHASAPEARVGVAHGKMSKEQLEHVMEDFAAGELDVLVATTIIESGIDNPHTNTLIIEDSQRLGLSQMYQLKGRVGRSSLQAFAYFMFPEDAYLSEDAHARLEALSDNQDLGSGMQIALKDLEIRGAGDILGAEQSGNMSAVGFDLFSQLLNQAVGQIRETPAGSPLDARDLSDITVSIPGHAFFSDDFLPDIGERVLWYRKVASAYTVEDVDAIQAELIQSHGELPREVQSLFQKARLRAFAAKHGVSHISVSAGKLNAIGLTLDREGRIGLKRSGGRYLEDKKKLIIGLDKVSSDAEDDDGADDLSAVILRFLERIMEGESDGSE